MSKFHLFILSLFFLSCSFFFFPSSSSSSDCSQLRLESVEKIKKEDRVSGTFTWKINGFSNKLTSGEWGSESEVFVVGGFKWKISLYLKGINTDLVSVYLKVADASTLPACWSRYAEFSLTLVDQVDRKWSISADTEEVFSAEADNWGWKKFIALSSLQKLSKKLLVNDTCIVEAKVSIRKSDIKILENETGELIDFKGVGKIELAFHPLLEEVCLLHPMLVKSQQKRSRAYVEFSFTTLGRLLHFLKTTKVKDLDRDGYARLQRLWEELEAFKFDLAWLQPHIHSVHDMKNMVGRVDRMREDVKLLENEIKKRRGMLAAAEADIERAKEDLARAENGFVGVDGADSVVGYPLA